MEFTTEGFQEKILKPWGEEILLTPKDLDRAGKIISVKAGKKLSYQYHDIKEETICLFTGKALLWLEISGKIEKISMKPNYGYTIYPNQKHRLEALEDSVFMEVSSTESGTTVRIEDDYSRPDETEELRSKPNRGYGE